MKYVPHEYQEYAKEFIVNQNISALFLDCGLGKTIITLTAIWELLLDYFEVRKVLVIAPLRVARNTWPGELKKWEHLQGTCDVSGSWFREGTDNGTKPESQCICY